MSKGAVAALLWKTHRPSVPGLLLVRRHSRDGDLIQTHFTWRTSFLLTRRALGLSRLCIHQLQQAQAGAQPATCSTAGKEMPRWPTGAPGGCACTAASPEPGAAASRAQLAAAGCGDAQPPGRVSTPGTSSHPKYALSCAGLSHGHRGYICRLSCMHARRSEPLAAPLRVALLLSGGVDSSLALRLLQQAGHHVEAFYLQIWFQDDFRNFWSACPWEDDLAVCRQVGRLRLAGCQLALQPQFSCEAMVTACTPCM